MAVRRDWPVSKRGAEAPAHPLTFYQTGVISGRSDRPRHYLKVRNQLRDRFVRTCFMVELAAVVIGLFSAGIFVAHTVEANRAQ